MSGSVSFVIPVLNEQGRVADLLSDLRQRYPLCELIVVDGGSRDATVVIALPLCDQLLLGDRGRAHQMNLGGQVASLPYIFFLHADSLSRCLRRGAGRSAGPTAAVGLLPGAPEWPALVLAHHSVVHKPALAIDRCRHRRPDDVCTKSCV